MNFQLPSYWLPRPDNTLNDALRSSFDALLEEATARGPSAWIDYPLDAPKWQFLCYVAEERNLVLHGSLDPDISVFEPRQPHDLREFGAQRAVYAAADGIWPIYFAILDRERFPMALINGCIRLEAPNGEISPPYYHFSVGRHVFDKHPWRQGVVYLLPRDPFFAEPPIPFGEFAVHTAQLASLIPVAPLARLVVAPEDFPFLGQVRIHDDERLDEYATALQRGLPWPGDEAE